MQYPPGNRKRPGRSKDSCPQSKLSLFIPSFLNTEKGSEEAQQISDIQSARGLLLGLSNTEYKRVIQQKGIGLLLGVLPCYGCLGCEAFLIVLFFRGGFLTFGTIGTLDQIILCCRGCPAHCRMLAVSPAFIH